MSDEPAKPPEPEKPAFTTQPARCPRLRMKRRSLAQPTERAQPRVGVYANALPCS